ncbi:MAG: hypothetical protein LKI93_05550 [Bifidobacteriaceae bacterium]|jgi:membrane protein YdbS with pleckstrin-like domain|nr:hypothetical protein [Bifidobacteriaceae bacterium]MCI1914276.1 hypothetical protein [Bifidobacteriaceae bacterium]
MDFPDSMKTDEEQGDSASNLEECASELAQERVRRRSFALVVALVLSVPALVTAISEADVWMLVASAAEFIFLYLVMRFFLPPMYPARREHTSHFREWIERHSGAVTLTLCLVPAIVIQAIKHASWQILGIGMAVTAVAIIVVEIIQRTTRAKVVRLWGEDASSSDRPSSPPAVDAPTKLPNPGR